MSVSQSRKAIQPPGYAELVNLRACDRQGLALGGGSPGPAGEGFAGRHDLTGLFCPLCAFLWGFFVSPALGENVVVAGGGVVSGDDGKGIRSKRPKVVDAATNTLAVAAPGAARTAVGEPGCGRQARSNNRTDLTCRFCRRQAAGK